MFIHFLEVLEYIQTLSNPLISMTWSPLVIQLGPITALLTLSVSVMLFIISDIIFSVSHLMPSTPDHWLIRRAENP